MRRALLLAWLLAGASFVACDDAVYPAPCVPGYVADDAGFCRPAGCKRNCSSKKPNEPDGCGGVCTQGQCGPGYVELEEAGSTRPRCVCDPASCLGCCSSDGNACHADSKSNDEFCGMPGDTCASCGGGTRCDQGSCR